MKIYDDYCAELKANGGILKDEDGIFYYKPGYKYHRVDGPAIEMNNGSKWWYYNDECVTITDGDVTPEQLLDFKLRIL